MSRNAVITAVFLILLLLLIPSPASAKTVRRGVKRNEEYLNELNPDIANEFRRFISDIESMGYMVIITSGKRSRERQAELHREDPRNATPGFSSHEPGNAVDLVLYRKGVAINKSSPASQWKGTGVVALAKNKYGMGWGGDFKNYFDPVHFYFK